MANIKFDLEDIKYFINHNYRELIISALLLSICIGLVFGGTYYFLSANRDKGRELEEQEPVVLEPLNLADKEFLVNGLFEYPRLNNFDVTNDYIQFMPLKVITRPDIDIIIDEYDKMVGETIDEACRFQFEKKRDKGRNK